VQHKQSGSDLGSAGPYAILVFWYRAGVTYFVASPKLVKVWPSCVVSPQTYIFCGADFGSTIP